ncbi:hypothetical protein FB645_003553 [Coemansia sp. IMI 203386]|nr:hypothetical protein FB645_003553 [Coemansia sp. IMI 203386]
MAEEEDYSALPLEQRLTHKTWKVRMNAYNELTTTLKQMDPNNEAAQFNVYENYLSKIVLDTNMAAQEAGISTVIAFVENAPNPTRRREEIVGGIVSKCLSATKAGTRTQSVELLLLLSEVDTPGPVVTGVIEGFDAKQPKAVAAAVAAVKDIVSAFGVKFLTLKPLLKALLKPFAHKDNSVRTEAQRLAVELYRWMGQAIMPSLQDLPSVLHKELEAQFAAISGNPPPKQTRLLRSQQEEEPSDEPVASNAGASSDNADDGVESAGSAAAEIDPWDMVDPVDITKKLPDDYYTFVVSSKWKERKEVIESLHGSLKKSIRLQMSPGTGDIIQEMGKKIADTNIIVATLAIQCLGLFASGLRQAFSPFVQSTLPALIEKSKERKQTVVDAIRETEDAYFLATGCDLASISDHYFTGASHKNPQTRAEANHMLRRCLAVVPTRPGKGDVKRYVDQLKSGLDDGDAGVRESAAECLGTLSKLVTAKVIEPFIESVDKIKLEKIHEYAEKATVKAKAPVAAKPKAPAAGARGSRPPPPRSKPAAKAPAAPSAAAPVSASNGDDGADGESGLSANLPPHIRKKLEASARAAAIKKAQREGKPIDDLLPPPPQPAAKPTPAARPSAPSGPPKRPAAAPAARKPAAAPKSGVKARPGAGTSASGGNKDEAIKMRFANDESLDDKIASAIPEAILSGFSSTKWKERMEAMDQLKEHLSNQAAGGTGVHPELVVRQLSRKPGWKESNFQVSQRAFQLIEWMANEEDLEFNTGAAALCAPTLVDKLGDIKLKGPSSNALVAIAQRFTLRFVVGLVIEPIRGQKSPKVLADCLAWLDTQMLEFGTKGLSLRPVVEMVKEVGLQSSNAQTRTKAVAFMGTLRRAVGPAVMDLMGDLNPQLLQLIEAEFERVGSQPMPEPIHTQRGLSGENGAGAAAAGSGSAPGSGAAAGEDPMDDLFPRQDLSALVGQNIYKKLGDNNWKERKAALDEIQSALDGANHRILPSISADLYTALKHRLQDPNKNLITVALGLLGALSADSGAAQIPNIRIVALATIHCLADKKPQLRVAALAAMMAWAEATPLCVDQAILPAIPNALGDSSPELRSSLLQWTADVLGPRNAKGIRLPDLSLLITPLFACLQDRNLEVRKQATRVLELTVISCGFETVLDACSMQLHGAAKNAVSPLIEDFRHSIGGEGSPAARRTVGMSAPGRGRPGGPAAAIERAASPAVEPVMTASELLGRAPAAAPTSATGAALQGRPMSMTAAAASSPKAASSAQAASSGGPGMLRRPLAVRRPAGPPGAPAAGARPARAMRGPMSAAGSAEVSRPGSSMRVGTPALQSQASQMARMSNEELESIPPILDCDFRSKDQRARRDMASNPNGVPRWAQLGDSRVRADLESQLCEQAAAHLNPLIQRQLFSTGHYKDRDYLTGLTTIEEVVSIPALSQQRFNLPLFSPSPDMDSLAARFMANIDILLKYISLRMYEGSTHTLLKSFDLLERLIHLTEENQNQQQQQGQASWSDYEVQAILPALVSRLGDAKEVVRSRSRRILTQLVTHLYPMTKLFTVLLEHGVTNRNNARIRQESLESVCFLIRERTAGCGLSAVCAQPSRAVPIIAQGIADRDSNVRTATLNVLVAVGEQLPGGAEDLWRLCGRIGEKERTMLEEKIKRSSIATDTVASAGAARPGSRIGMIPNASVAAARSRMGSSIARPSSQASGAIGGISRNGPQGSGIAAGIGAGLAGASRLARPAAPPATSVPPYGAADSNHASEYSTGHSYASSSRPMFSLDFDKLNLPSYSSSTMENLKNPSFARGSSLRSPAGAPSRPQASEVANTVIGYGAGRKESLQGALNGMHLGMAGGARAQEQYGVMQQMSGSPVMSSPGRPMSISAYNNTLSASDFPSMSEPEREEWMQGIIADLSGDDPKASEKAIDRFASLLETVPRPSDREKMDPQLYINQAGPAHYHIRKNLDSLVSAIAMQIRWAYTTTSTDLSMQSPFQSTLNLIRRSALEVLIQVFGNIYFAMWIRLDAIQTLIEELVYRAVDPMLKPSRSASGARVGNSAIPDSLGLSKAVNSILVRIIDYADRTTVYVALIRLFESAMAEPAPNPPQTDNDIMRMEFGDMVQKCLWRLTKVLPDDLKRQFSRYVDQDGVVELPREVVDPEFGNPLVHPAIRVHHILRMTHRFFVRVPDREWRKRSDKDAWMFGDLPRRTVKTIHHTIISYLGIYSWQFCGLIIRDVMEADNTLIRPAPSMASNVNDPAMIQWAQDTHGKLVRASETWGYVHTCLEADEYNGGVPTVAQLLVAMNVALNSPSSEVGDDLSDEDNDVVMNSVPTSNYHIQQQQQQQLFNQPASRGSYAGSAASVSPYQQPRQVGYSSQMQTTANNFSAARAQSPSAYSSSSRIGSMPHSYQPPAPAMARVSSPQPTGLPPMAPTGASGEYRSTQERFNALRARILNSQSILPQAQHPTSVPAPSSPISTGSASSAIPGRRLAAVDTSSTGIQPPEVPRTMEDIGARIARMRNSLRSNSTSKQ